MERYTGLTVDVPGKTFSNASLRYTSDLGFGGCQGFMRPAVLTLNGKDLQETA